MQNTHFPAIKAEKIIKDFKTGDTITRILHGIDLELFKGELAMLVGPSGCGKTTLISILSGILNPSAGNIWINNTDITHMDDTEKVLFRRKEIGFIFQQYNLLPALTAAENAAIPLIAANVPFEIATKKSAEMLSQIGMSQSINKKPFHLSGGQQQRVAIARALVHNPGLLVCDEPTAALDAHTGQTVMEILSEIAVEKTRTVLVVTHDNRIYKFADRIIHMSDGKIRKEEKQIGAK